MYTLKSIARRGTSFAAAMALVVSSVGSAVLPAMSAYADALNPLTDRSLTLSSSSPGWSFGDGSNNPTYAPPNSGANGQKTGNYYDFKVSSPTTVKGFSFQYCTSPAGICNIPGNDAVRGTDTATTTDLSVNFPSALEVKSGDFASVIDDSSAEKPIKAIPGYAGYSDGKPGGATGIGGAAAAVDGNFVVMKYDTGTSKWVQSLGWKATASKVVVNDSGTGAGDSNNFITLTQQATDRDSDPTSPFALTTGQRVRVLFFATDTNYITNPGQGAFFVRMNTYSDYTAGTPDTLSADDIIDGGVTVANVMNQSIWIQTKVLETMEFSVGTVDPNTLSSVRTGETDSDGTDATGTSELDDAYGNVLGNGKRKHGTCDRILGNITPDKPTNVLKLGDASNDYSLSTQDTYSTHSFWRLSSNASAGATVYYSGHTLTNTVGDEITPINNGNGTKTAPIRGLEQFGLAMANTDGIDHTGSAGPDNTQGDVSYAQEGTYENGNDVGKTSVHASVATDVNGNVAWHTPKLYPLVAEPNYNSGIGDINGTPTTQFAFNKTSDTVPVPIAKESTQVVDCVTGKMRYMANIAATTPAGIYTTKVNYIAAPQY